LDYTRYTVETRDHESTDLEVAKLLSKVYAFYEEEGHAIIVLLCLFTSKHALLNMWSYKMWQEH
jgi:hypothetical protein